MLGEKGGPWGGAPPRYEGSGREGEREPGLKSDSSDLNESVKSQWKMFQADKSFSCVVS